MNLKNVKHIDQLRRLGYPLNRMLIVGSGTMALLGIKENDDIDIWTDEFVYKKVSQDKRFVSKKVGNDTVFETKDGNIEIGKSLPCTKGSVKNYLKRAIIIYGVHFKSVDDVIAWKKCMGRPKDRQHLKLLYQYKKNKVNENYLDILKTI